MLLTKKLHMDQVLHAINTLIAVSEIKEKIFFVMFLVKLTHCGTSGRNDVVYKKEEGVFSSQVNSFTNQKVKLSD